MKKWDKDQWSAFTCLATGAALLFWCFLVEKGWIW